MFGFDDKKKKIFTICSIVYAVLILLVVIITNFDRFAGFYEWFNEKLAVLSPILIGAIIAYISNSLVRLFQNRIFKKVESKRWRRTLSILCAYVSIVVIISVFILLIIPQLLSSFEELVKKISDGTYLNALINAINEFLNNVISFSGEEAVEFISMEKITQVLSGFFESTGDLLQNIANWALSYGGNILNGLKNIAIGFLLSIYFVISKDRLYAQSTRMLAALFTKQRAEAIKEWFSNADKTFGGFIVGKLIDATTVIVLGAITFSIARIPYSILVAVLIGVCNIIPFFGPFIGAIPSGFIVFIAEPDKLLLFIILLLVVQQFDANIIEPKIVGDRTGLSSLGVLVAVTVMSGYLGLVGMFLGVPIFAMICSGIKKAIKRRLAEKELSADLADYYSADSLEEPHVEAEHLSAKVFRLSGTWIKKERNLISQKLKKRKKSKPAKDETVSHADTQNENQ